MRQQTEVGRWERGHQGRGAERGVRVDGRAGPGESGVPSPGEEPWVPGEHGATHPPPNLLLLLLQGKGPVSTLQEALLPLQLLPLLLKLLPSLLLLLLLLLLLQHCRVCVIKRWTLPSLVLHVQSLVP